MVFEESVIAIGIIGGIANLLMFLILARSKVRKLEMATVFNQMVLDFICCLQLVISYVLKIVDIDYSITIIGSVVCKTLTGETMIWYFLGSSTANLVVLTLERYVKIAHAVFHKRNFRQWMSFVAISFTWVNFDITLSAFVDSSATIVLDGYCAIYAQFPTSINASVYANYKFIFNYIVPLVVFVFCYSCILQITRKRIVPGKFLNMDVRNHFRHCSSRRRTHLHN